MPHGALTESQYLVLACRGRGMTQRETARVLNTTRANVSMIELRARRKVALARETLDAYRSTLTDHLVSIPRGTRFYDIPPLVLGEADRWGVHIQSNIVDIVRMVKGLRPTCLRNGRTTRSIRFVFNRGGKLRAGKPAILTEPRRASVHRYRRVHSLGPGPNASLQVSDLREPE